MCRARDRAEDGAFLRAKGSHFRLESLLTKFDLHLKNIFWLHVEAGLVGLGWVQGGQ